MENLTYFKYKIRKLQGYAKVAEQSNVKFLQKCKIDGFHFIKKSAEYAYFKIDNQLYRLLKLYHIGNHTTSHKVKTLHFLVDISKQVHPDEVKNDIYGSYNGYWFNTFVDYEDDEVAFKKQEQKERVRNQNKLYKHQYKLKK